MEATLWQLAASFAARAHVGTLRKDGRTPYVAHPFRVAMTVRHVFGCEDEVAIVAALLHDTIEDTTTDYDDLEAGFGREVADCVAAMSKNMILREAVRETDYDERLARGPWQARLIKLADVYDNVIDRMPKSRETEERLRNRKERAVRLASVDADRAEVARALECVRALDI